MSKIAKPVKSRLGRGLSSLISVSELPVEADISPDASPPSQDRAVPASGSAVGQTIGIPVAAITPNPHQPRRQMNEAAIAELAASIKSTGLIQPIVVRAVADGYQLIAGERRLRAARLAGLATIPALVREVDSSTQAQMALVENIQREDLNPIDRATSYQALIDQLGLTQAELASRLGEDRSSIANHVRLLGLEETVRNKVRDGALSLGHAKLLAGVSDLLDQARLASLVVAQQLSVRNLERLLQPAAAGRAARSMPVNSAHIQELERSLTHQLGLRVEVKASAKKGHGRVIVHYTSLTEFDDLMKRLAVELD
jgi:ParB family transcriptional regulator, chromosome partitioning protein